MAREKKSGSADLGRKAQEAAENGRQAKDRTPSHEQPGQDSLVVDFLQEANTLLDEIGRFQRAFRLADVSPHVSHLGDAPERLYGAVLWAEALVRNSARLVSVGTAQNWGYLLLRSHTQMARQILTHRSIPVEIAQRLRSMEDIDHDEEPDNR